MRIAIVHDQLQEFGGAERVLVALKNIFANADVFTSFYSPDKLGYHSYHFKNWGIQTSWADKIPLLKKFYSPLRFITPLIWKGFNFDKYDVVISSSGSYMSKGIKTSKKTIHICYLHHPPRYLYGYETAIEWQKYWPIKVYGNLINHDLRLYDYSSSQSVNYFVANSIETQKRIEKFYRRKSIVIYPPVNIQNKLPPNSYLLTPNYYLTVSRLARAKHIDIIINAANQMKFKLKVVGLGRDLKYLQSIAGSTVEILSNITDQQLSDIYKNAKAYLFASVDEEFGIAPVEAMGYGLPVIAYESGGLKETVVEGKNGYLFDQLTPEFLCKKIKEFENLSKKECQQMRINARNESEKYTEEIFKNKFLSFINRLK
ncbi:hypothetical protein AUK04_03415 [Candidatus Roizmanbacteria bacterium CG2_30_33_16]|uniref:Uncharacterized protein n=4 Tax=Candidatus Roizmaniibacteriota TaxID=1752723 RepID=A0A2M8DC40_9BACT|nr:MAG: hypothetical protein AUK04_03415 [Candidatus Roizmanbacteria bacterium CG2_30_33_16]PJB87949.1 MAG: hypothetical protein CO083_04365 [Candidatus Roizmanbacteria bacterium CG_4_9_14_0_8_um_filter_34_12]